MATIATRQKIVQSEMTRDPIFLFQTQCVHPTEDFYFGDYFYCSDCASIIEGDEHEHSDNHELGAIISTTEAIKRGVLAETWETRLVFYTREEADEFGRQNSHNYDPWQVYCVPAHGKLAKVLCNVELDEVFDLPALVHRLAEMAVDGVQIITAAELFKAIQQYRK